MKPKKSLGQNFLTNPYIKNKIIMSINPNKKDIILEIGPGKGALTYDLAKNSKKIYIIELDSLLFNNLNTKTLKINNITSYNDNILNFNINNIIKKEHRKIRVIGNIPYNISVDIINYLTKFKHDIADIFLMLQTEIAEKLLATNKSKLYGRLSVLTQYNFQIKNVIKCTKEDFIPQPVVNSNFIKLIPYKNNNILFNYDNLKFITKKAFNQRRKKISHLLKELNINHDNINTNKRPEELSIKEYILLSNLLTKKFKDQIELD